MGIANGKWYCPECGWAAKGPCPQHPGSAVLMGTRWRPGKKNSRTRIWDDRVPGRRDAARRVTGGSKSKHYHQPVAAPQAVLELGGRDRTRLQTGAGWLRTEDPVTWAIHERVRRGRVRRKK